MRSTLRIRYIIDNFFKIHWLNYLEISQKKKLKLGGIANLSFQLFQFSISIFIVIFIPSPKAKGIGNPSTHSPRRKNNNSHSADKEYAHLYDEVLISIFSNLYLHLEAN